MARNSSSVSANSQQYTINTMEGFAEGSASFVYRGFEISFSTMGYNGFGSLQSVLVIADEGKGDIIDDKSHTVEDAIAFVNKRIDG